MKRGAVTLEKFKTLPTSAVILDASGRIVAVNDTWKNFGRRNGLRIPHSAVGSNYLQYCRSDDPALRRFVRDLKSLLTGRLDLLTFIYPCHSGKTTLLSVLGCILTPTSGTVRVCGQATEGADAQVLAKLRRDHVGFVFQSYHLFPTLTAAENIQLALDIRGTHGEDARAKSRDALEKVGLAHKSASYPRELSGGEQQRVAIARAIVSNPSAIFADEPTAVLDTSNGQAIMSILAEIAKDPAHGVLVVTHDPRMTSLADRVIHIEDGRFVRDERGSADAAMIRTTDRAGRCT